MKSQRVRHDWATANAGDSGDMGSIPGSGWYPGIYSCLENSTNRGTWTVCGTTKSRTQLRDWAHNTFTYMMSLNSYFTNKKSHPESKLLSGSAKTHLCESDPRAHVLTTALHSSELDRDPEFHHAACKSIPCMDATPKHSEEKTNKPMSLGKFGCTGPNS